MVVRALCELEEDDLPRVQRIGAMAISSDGSTVACCIKNQCRVLVLAATSLQVHPRLSRGLCLEALDH